jgi:hypothetical protein
MKNKNFLFYFFISIFLIFLSFSPNLKADIANNSLENAQKLANHWIIQNNSNNKANYKLDSSITRREMLKVMLNIAWVNVWNSCTWKFADLKSSDWWCKYAETALKLWYISANKNFRPNDAVSKAESLKMLFKAKNIEIKSTSDWREWYVKKSYELWFSENFFDYDTPAKRSFVFNVWANVIDNNTSWTSSENNQTNSVWNDLMCLQVITPAKNKETWECVNFPNSCIPSWFEKTDKCEKNESSFKKSKLIFAFNDEMNEASVEKNIKIFPELKYASSWKDEKTLELTLNDVVNKELDVLVNVLDEATLKNWDKLWATVTKKYKIDWNAVVDFVSPEGQLTDKNGNITVRFSKPMVSLTNLDNGWKCPITITPELPWKCVWITTSTFQYRPTLWFPAWARFSVLIPAWLQTIAWDKTLESKVFEIITPDFKLLSSQSTLKNDEKLNFLFNDDISLEDFKNNFSITGINKSDLNFEYLQIPTSIEWKYDTNKAWISIFPKSWNWWYGKSYSYTISSNMKSERWNRGLNEDIGADITINKFLNRYSPLIINDKNAKDIYLDSNFIFPQDNLIITKNNPSILFKFEKEVQLEKSLFSLDYPFTVNYVKIKDYSDSNTPKIIEDKKQIILTIDWKIENSLKIWVNTYKYSQTNHEVNFQTKEENKIISYNQINYKKACITLQEQFWDNINYKSFEFDKYGKVSYVYQVYEYSNDADCKYEEWKNKYIVTTQLNPENDYKLTIKNTLLDNDNYPLDKDYSYTFKTWKALNEDKSISILDSRNDILVPKSINPLTISLSSINLKQAEINVCEWDLDINESWKIKNENCKKKTINITNLWFKTNISVIDLKQIFWNEFTKNYITIEVSKLDSDKTDYEKKNSNYKSKASFIISDISAVIKSWEKWVLWLRNFNTWENLDDQIEKIESYKEESDYWIFWEYKWVKYTYDKNINFSFIKNWLYEIDKAGWNLLITLKSQEQVYLWNTYWYYDSTNRVYNYLSTDKPIYKAWEKVNIKWISRIIKATWYDINTWNVKVTIQDSKYKELYNKDLSLNSLWAFDIALDLKNDSSLWTYYVSVWNNSLQFLVEEYEKPDFKIETSSRQGNYLNTQTALVDITWNYYIWMPLSYWEWSYSITSSDYYFDWWKTTWYTWWENNDIWWRNSSSYSSNWNYKNWKFTLWEDWKYTLWVDSDINATSDKTYTVSVSVTDPNTKKSISTNTNFVSLRSNTFLWIKFDKYYYDFKDEANIGFTSVDIDWNKKWNTDFNFSIYKVDYKYNENTYEYEESEKLLSEKSLKTDNSWVVSDKYTFLDYWEYRVEIETKDKKYKTTKVIYVSWGNVLKPMDAENKVEVLSNKEEYNVWENAEIVISSPVVWVKALVTIEKLNEVLDAEVIDINDFNQKETLTIKKEFLPNFNVWVYIIKDIKTNSDKLEELKNIRSEMLTIEQTLQKEKSNVIIPYTIFDFKISPTLTNEDLDKDLLSKLATLRFKENSILNDILPKYYIWNKEIKVNTNVINLNTQVNLDKKTYLPWDKEIINLNITDSNWKPITWEVTLKVIDESLLALKNNNVSIKDFFYWNVWNEISTIWNLSNIIKRIDFNKLEEEKWIWWAAPSTANYSSDSIELSDLFWDLSSDTAQQGTTSTAATSWASIEKKGSWWDNSLESKIRTEFKDLAYYKWTIDVKDWKAQIIVDKLPDNLTTWVISWVVYTSDTKVWEIETKFKVQKNLSILPQIPRFFTNWDIAKIWWLVVNNTSNPLNIEASLEMTNAKISTSKQNIQIPANSSKLLEFNVEVGNKDDKEYNSSTEIKIIVKNTDNSLSDTIVLTKPIYKENSWEYVFTNWSTNDLSYEEKINLPEYLEKDGYVEISLWASILTNLLQNVDKTLYFPSDDLYSKLIFLENSDILEKLYKNVWETDKFENIRVKDYYWKTYKVSEVNKLIKDDIKNYLQADNWLSYFKNCETSYYYPTCSSMWVTWEYLSLWITIPGIDNKNVVEYYKKELTKQIEENKAHWILTTNIWVFIPLAVQKETEFINNYFKPREDLTNNDKLDYIKLYTLLWTKWAKVDTYVKDLRNSLIIEARWTFLPSGEWYSYQNNSYSTALMLRTLLEKNIGDKLETENLARWLLSQRDEEWSYYIDSVSEILKALSLYVEKNEQLNNLNFEWKAFLNSKVIMSSKFNSENKFSIDKEKFPLESNINFWEDNSLWFEKTWTWKLYYDVWVRYFLPNSKLEARDEWIIVSRNYYKYDDYKNAFKKTCFYPWWWAYSYSNYCIETKTKEVNPIISATKWDLIVGEVELTVSQERTNVVVSDFLPAWAEILNTNFDTTSDEAKDISWSKSNISYYYWFNYVEQKDNMVYLFANHLKPGTYKYTYVIKGSYAWKYSLKPATAELLDKPEVWWRSNWSEFEIK